MTKTELIQMAFAARKKAYCPYSHFAVGAALLCSDGTVYQGCNIENMSYTPSNCAERTAFFTAVLNGQREFQAIAIVGGEETTAYPEKACPPCGVCLQVMMEFCNPETFEILLVHGKESYESYLLKELLPFGFVLEQKAGS